MGEEDGDWMVREALREEVPVGKRVFARQGQDAVVGWESEEGKKRRNMGKVI